MLGTLLRWLFGPRPKRRRDTGKVRIEAWRENQRRECQANLEASTCYTTASQLTRPASSGSIPTRKQRPA